MIEMGHFSTFLPLCLNCPPPAMQSLQEKFPKTIKTDSADSANEGNEEAPVLLFLPNISALVRNFPLCLPCGPANGHKVFFHKRPDKKGTFEKLLLMTKDSGLCRLWPLDPSAC